MTDQMIQEAIARAVKASKDYGICYLLSNGKNLDTAVTTEMKEYLKERGYWVAAIYEHGHQVAA